MIEFTCNCGNKYNELTGSLDEKMCDECLIKKYSNTCIECGEDKGDYQLVCADCRLQL